MAEYWVTFRLADDEGYRGRYDEMMDALDQATTGWWIEPTSFIICSSNLEIDSFTSKITRPLSARKDLLVVRKLDVKDARYFGKVEFEDTLRAFLPYAKKVG